MTQPEKHLYRSRSNRVFAGVCGGLAEFFGLDATLIRLAFVLGIVFGFGSLLVVYLVMLFIVPELAAGNRPGTALANAPSITVFGMGRRMVSMAI